MRNLKRALSLTLASVMLLGMMVIGTSAVAGYSDVDVNDNVEAIEVLQAVEVMVGDDRGFGPDRPVTRAEMAVVMGKLLNLDYNYYVSTCPFADVSGNYEWARGWVGACAANGIVSGRGDGIYDPGATVTAIEAASMMMRALGYFKYVEDYNDGFVLVTVRQGNQIGLFNGVGSDGSTPMTRNQVAQMALNALRSEMVDFTGTLGVELNGVKVNYRAEYTSRTSTEKKYNAIEGRTSDVASDANHKGQYYVQLGEELYDGKLRLNNSATDAFGRPSRHWEYDGKAIGTYMKKELLDKEWTTEVTGKDLYDLLGSDTIKNYSFDVTIDGVSIDEKTGTTDNNTVLKANAAGKANSYFDETYMAKTYKSGVGQTGKGVLTQVFVNADTKEVDVAVINTYLAQATSDYNEKKDEVSLKVYALTSDGSGNDEVFYKYPGACKVAGESGQTKTLKVSGDDFAIEDVKKDDIFLVTASNGDIQTISDPEVLAAVTLNGFSRNSYVVSDGTQYDYNTTVEYDSDTLDDYTSISATQQLKDTQYNVYLDPYGYLIGVKIVDAVNNYVFLTGIDLATSNLKRQTAKAAGILTDGTFVEFTMDLTNSVSFYKQGGKSAANATFADGAEFTSGPLWNTWCTYTVDKDGVYTLTEVKQDANKTSKDKAGQYHDHEAFAPTASGTVTPAANAAGKKINDKNTSLKGASNKYVYGNDKTVYIVPELKKIASDSAIAAGAINYPTNGTNDRNSAIAAKTDLVGIIGGVDSISTGIANVDLVTWNAEDIKSEVNDNGAYLDAYSGGTYTLYNNNGYIIAAVVVGEDNGSTKSLIYSDKSEVKDEFYANDEWTWTREVISNGERLVLTEKGSKLAASGLKAMDENVWYEVTYKADGTVKEVTPAYYTDKGLSVGANPASNPALSLTNTGTPFAGSFVNNIAELEWAINNNNKTTTLYEEVWGDGTAAGITTGKTAMTKVPSLKESTLYVDTAASKGFYVHDNVKAVLIQKNEGKSTTEWLDGKSQLESALEDLNFRNGTYLFKVSAIMTNGRASVVIIHDWNGTDAQTDGDRNPTGDIRWINTDKANNYASPTWWTQDGSQPTLDQVREMLESEGCTAISYDAVSGWSFTTKGGTRVTGQTITLGANQLYKVEANGKTNYFTGSTAWNAILDETYTATTHGDYAMNGTTPVPMNANYSVTGDVKFDIGYYRVTVTAPTSAPTNGGGTYTAAVTKNEYVKAGADVTVEVKITTDDATTGSGVLLSVTAPVPGVSITGGAVIDGAAGNYNVKLSVDKAQIKTGGVDVTLSAANAPTMINVTVDGTSKTIDATTQFKDVLEAGQRVAKVYFKVTEAGGDVKFLETTSTATLNNGDSINTVDKYLKVTGVTAGTGAEPDVDTGTATVDYDITTGTETATGGADKYVKSGSTVTITVTVTSSETGNDTIKADTKATVVAAAAIATLADQTPDASTNLFADGDTVVATDGVDGTITVKVTAKAAPTGDLSFTINWAP